MSPIAKLVFKITNGIVVKRYRASQGRKNGSVKGMPVLLLTVPGRKTGQLRTTPVVYLKSGDRWVVTGSAGGSQTEPQWFSNLRATDRATVEVGADRSEVRVSIADDAERAELWRELVSVAPFFDGYQKKCDRVIPMAILTPK
jgi:deazaflavin-dependent oxidoreductase (nitroreductase family)